MSDAKEEKRTPMLSDEEIARHGYDPIGNELKDAILQAGMRRSRVWYEAKITSGELRVVKTTKNCNSATGWFTCLNCGATMANAYYSYPPHHSEHGGRIDFCPGCGEPIAP